MKLQSLGEVYQNLANDVEKHGEQWRKWYDYEKPEIETLPTGYTKLNAF